MAATFNAGALILPNAINYSARTRFTCLATANWKQVVDPASGKHYYWDIKTNETRWEPPKQDEESERNQFSKATVTVPQLICYGELTEILLSAQPDKFGDVANSFRPQCFEYEYIEYLTKRINEETADFSLALERLRAKLSNPLLKNPPPY